MEKIRESRLIINADDYGMSPLFNKGILELADKGIISSTTVMVKRKKINSKKLSKIKNISIGLHLELKEKDTEKEIENQIKKFSKIFKKTSSHLDGHKHQHLTESNLPKMIKIAKKHKLPLRSRLGKDRKIIKKNKIKTPDIYISWHPKRKNILFEKLRKLEKNKTSKTIEMVCHPGYYDKNSQSSYNRQREKELKILKSREFQKIIKNFKLIRYDEF